MSVGYKVTAQMQRFDHRRSDERADVLTGDSVDDRGQNVVVEIGVDADSGWPDEFGANFSYDFISSSNECAGASGWS